MADMRAVYKKGMWSPSYSCLLATNSKVIQIIQIGTQQQAHLPQAHFSQSQAYLLAKHNLNNPSSTLFSSRNLLYIFI